MERSYILHMFTPAKQVSPFDINMAVDAGWQVIATHCQVEARDITALTQDAIFSRGPKGVARTGIFIGGRDAMGAMDMLDAARRAMVPPFQVALFADPSGAYTTAAGMVASVEGLLARQGSALAGRRVLVLGGTGPVGRIAGVMAAQAGAQVTLSSHGGAARAQAAAQETGARFGLTLAGAGSGSADDLRAALAEADVVLACAAAGVQVLATADLAHAPRLQVVADVNAVPPLGVQGLGVMDAGVSVAGGAAGQTVLGIGALAIGNVKYQTQHRLLAYQRDAGKPVVLGPAEAFAMARSVVAESA